MRGFTLIEFLANLSVVMTLSAISFPMVATSLDTYRLRHDTRQLAAQCQNARFLAIASNVSHRVHWSGSRVEIQRRTAGGYTTLEHFFFSPGITVVSAWDADPVFTPRGTVSPSAAITLENQHATRRTVSISVIGRVTEQ